MSTSLTFPLFFFNDTATTEIYTLSLHDALPITVHLVREPDDPRLARAWVDDGGDRKSTRLNSSHVEISYAVFCLKKKNFTHTNDLPVTQQMPADMYAKAILQK